MFVLYLTVSCEKTANSGMNSLYKVPEPLSSSVTGISKFHGFTAAPKKMQPDRDTQTLVRPPLFHASAIQTAFAAIARSPRTLMLRIVPGTAKAPLGTQNAVIPEKEWMAHAIAECVKRCGSQPWTRQWSCSKEELRSLVAPSLRQPRVKPQCAQRWWGSWKTFKRKAQHKIRAGRRTTSASILGRRS